MIKEVFVKQIVAKNFEIFMTVVFGDRKILEKIFVTFAIAVQNLIFESQNFVEKLLFYAVQDAISWTHVINLGVQNSKVTRV